MVVIPVLALVGYIVYMMAHNKELALAFGIICGIGAYIALTWWLLGTGKWPQGKEQEQT